MSHSDSQPCLRVFDPGLRVLSLSLGRPRAAGSSPGKQPSRSAAPELFIPMARPNRTSDPQLNSEIVYPNRTLHLWKCFFEVRLGWGAGDMLPMQHGHVEAVQEPTSGRHRRWQRGRPAVQHRAPRRADRQSCAWSALGKLARSWSVLVVQSGFPARCAFVWLLPRLGVCVASWWAHWLLRKP